ncbi:hypothetical protein OPU67_13580 [Erythrobacter sp. WG]|nr:hypothetical protein [Erythrobacter sp. WG]MCX9148368.1 hypothetical protein [Erythrobacter sp. WG]
MEQLEQAEPVDDVLVRRRGLIHIVDNDPAESVLPPRHLAVHLLNGRNGAKATGLAAMTRRLTMLQDLRKRSIKQLVFVIPGQFEIPEDFTDLWADGYRTSLAFVSDDPHAAEAIALWRSQNSAPLVDEIRLGAAEFADALRKEFLRGRDGSVAYIIRNEKGELRTVDGSGIDDPERPVLGSYDLIGVDALTPLLPADLSSTDVDQFFMDPTASWRPYAAGMVWERDAAAWGKVRGRLRLLDKEGPENNRIFYVKSQSGAGATTFLRDLAWRAAAEGYPTLVARKGMIPLNGLEVANFLGRLTSTDTLPSDHSRVYETPCVIVFDESHWEGRYLELLNFAREVERSGRRVCILVATGPFVGLDIMTERRFVELAYLSHEVTFQHALKLGQHLNRFLSPHGTDRSEAEWRAFIKNTTVEQSNGLASFWIVLSFWLGRQIDLGETIQSKIYAQFKSLAKDESIKHALLRIAAFSTVRTPLPENLLPPTEDWPIADKLEDLRRASGVLSLTRIVNDLDRSWALAHDLVGTLMLQGFFFDPGERQALGFEEAANPLHLRFLILKSVASLPELAKASLRLFAEEFAVSIFKIDPDHGHGTLVFLWKEVLEALDDMPRELRTTSRTFLHHTAISRRRIASNATTFMMSAEERAAILQRAVDDIRGALKLEAEFGDESDLNLFNSLAQALHDLAEAEEAAGRPQHRVLQTRAEAQEATRQAYTLNPDNSFVVETYARTLLSEGKTNPDRAATRALEVLTLVYSMMEKSGAEARLNALERLAERAFELLLEAGGSTSPDPQSEAGAIARALYELGGAGGSVRRLEDVPRENRARAASLLSIEALLGNVQAVKLRYMIAVIDNPNDFDLHIGLLQSLQESGPAFTPQMELELALLLFQKDRAHEGNRLFLRLRRMWRQRQHFVEVPDRLHWLLDPHGSQRRQVRARVSSNGDGRGFARVSDFQDIEVPFRPHEFSQEKLRPGSVFSAYVSFSHNGPFLRPLTSGWR